MSWYTIRNHAPGVADVAISGVIDASDTQRFCAALPQGARTIRLLVSSLGGDPTAAMAIAQALRAHPARVEVTIQGIAGSASTLPVCAGNRVVIDAGACAMIHNPHAVLDDTPPLDAPTLRAVADQLDRVKGQMVDVYGWRLKGGREAIAKVMDAVTWFDPAEAVRLGLADEVGTATPSAATAHVDAVALAQLGPIPARFKDLIARLRDPSRARDAVLAKERPRLNVSEYYSRLNNPTRGGRP